MRTMILWLVAMPTCMWGCGGGADVLSNGDTGVSDIFVDPTNGSDAAAGTEEAPLKTLKAALSMAVSPQTIWLQKGTYSEETGEDWNVPVPGGVNLSAVAPGEAVLVGPGPFSDTHVVALDLAGDAEVRGLRVEAFPCAVRATQGQQLLEDVQMDGNHQGFRLSGSAETTCAGCELFEFLDGFHLEDASSLKLDRTEVANLVAVDLTAAAAPVKDCGPYQIGSASGAATLWLVSSHVHGAFQGISLRGAAVAHVVGSTIDNVAIESQPGSCGAGFFELADSPKVYVSKSLLAGVTKTAVLAHDDAGELTLVDSTIRAMGGGYAIAGLKKLTMESSTLTGTEGGYSGVRIGHGSLNVTDTLLAGFQHGIVMQGSAKVRVRSSHIACDTAILLFGGSLDLGVPEDPGLNHLASADHTALTLFTEEAVTVYASGNGWIESCQGSSADGTYPVDAEIAGPFGCADPAPRNLCLSNPGPKVVF